MTQEQENDEKPNADELFGKLDIDSEWGGYVIETKHETRILVLSMLINDRIVEIQPGERMYHRYWCYPKGGSAILAALAWGGDPESEPVGFIKSWDQRYSNPGIGQLGVDGERVTVPERDRRTQ